MSVVKLYPENAAENPDNVLEQAIGEYQSVAVLGYDENENLVCRASTNVCKKDLIWMIEEFKLMLLQVPKECDE